MARAIKTLKKQTFRFIDPDAQRVLLADDFTRWQEGAIPMKKGADGLWTASVSLDPGAHLPQEKRNDLVQWAAWLADEFPNALFRSGNAEGTDEVFAEAVAARDASRLELVVPHLDMGRGRRPANARCFSLDSLPQAELEQIVSATRRAGRDAGRLADYYLSLPAPRKGAAASKASYLLRGTLKVVGSRALGLAPATLGIFFVNPDNPNLRRHGTHDQGLPGGRHPCGYPVGFVSVDEHLLKLVSCEPLIAWNFRL